MPSSHQPPSYQSWLLRLWEERLQEDNRPTAWRFSLEDAQTRERRVFAGVEALCAYLATQMISSPQEPTEVKGSPSSTP